MAKPMKISDFATSSLKAYHDAFAMVANFVEDTEKGSDDTFTQSGLDLWEALYEIRQEIENELRDRKVEGFF